MSDTFSFVKKEVPSRSYSRGTGRYEKTIQEILKSKENPVKIELGDTKPTSAYQSFNRIVKNSYSDKVCVHKIAGEIYIEKI
jgi:hypothetical protein